MIKKFKITNGDNETLVLDLFQPELSGFAVREVSGLGPVQATVNMAEYASKPGGKFQGSKLGTREIIFDLVFLDSLASIENVRHQSYRYFSVGEKITIEIETDERHVTTTGYVETNEPAIWDSEYEGAEITVLCESPYLFGKDMIIKNLTSAYSAFHFPFTSLATPPELLFGYVKVGNDLKITNGGEAESGCIFTIIALEDFSNPLIYNDLDGTYFGLMINVDEGDKLIINTKIGEKSAKLIRNDQEYNVINYLKSGSTWFQLKKGENSFSIGHADTYTKTISGNSVTINADTKKYNVNEVRFVTPIKQSSPEKATALKPKNITIPTGFNVTGTKTLWFDADTNKGRYNFYEISSDVTPVEGKTYYTRSGEIYTEADVSSGFTPGVDYYEYADSKSETFSRSIEYLIGTALNKEGDSPAANRAPAAFGAGYLRIIYEKETAEDETAEEEDLTGSVQVVMTHVKIPYYSTNKLIDVNWSFSNTYNKGVKYTYAKMKFKNASFAYDSTSSTNITQSWNVTVLDDISTGTYPIILADMHDPVYNYTANDIISKIELNGKLVNSSQYFTEMSLQSQIIRIKCERGFFELKTNDVITITIKKGTASQSSSLNLTKSKLKANSTIYSNRFVYHPEFNTAATVKELSYYFPDMKGQSKCVSYWDNNGYLVLVEFQKGNYTTSKAKYKKLKNGKKKLIKKKDKTAKGASKSNGYKHWKYSTAKKWLKANPTYVIVELAKPITYYINERLDVSDVDDTSDLERLLYGILEDYKLAIDDKITLTTNNYSSNTVKASIEANYTKNVTSRWQYFNDPQTQSLSLTNCTNSGVDYMRVFVPARTTPYNSIRIYVNGEMTEITEISTNDKKFYGGYIDITNGTITYSYDSSGDPIADPQDDDDILDGTEIELDDGDNTIYTQYSDYAVTEDETPQSGKVYYTLDDGNYILAEDLGDTFEQGVTYYEVTTGAILIDSLIYLVNDQTILDRMNLKIEHDNAYLGI